MKTHFQDLFDEEDNTTLKTEWQTLKNSMVSEENHLPVRNYDASDVMNSVVKNKDFKSIFPNLFKISLIGLLIPASTADCERGFSALKRIKTPLRNWLNSVVTNNLLMLAIEGPEGKEFDFSLAVDVWGRAKNRRINVLS